MRYKSLSVCRIRDIHTGIAAGITVVGREGKRHSAVFEVDASGGDHIKVIFLGFPFIFVYAGIEQSAETFLPMFTAQVDSSVRR